MWHKSDGCTSAFRLQLPSQALAAKKPSMEGALWRNVLIWGGSRVHYGPLISRHKSYTTLITHRPSLTGIVKTSAFRWAFIKILRLKS